MIDLTWVRRWPDGCGAETTRDGELVPCERPAVAARLGDEEDGRAWPVCVHHARVGQMVSLRDLLGLP